MSIVMRNLPWTESPPGVLYKYLGPDRVDVLSEAMLRFTQPAAFNDPFEDQSSVVAEDVVEGIPSDAVRTVESVLFKDLPDTSIIKHDVERMFDILRWAAPTEADCIINKISEKWRIKRIGLDPNKMLGILCLSEVSDDVLMWSHYANGHTGFAIGFNTAHDYFLPCIANERYPKKVKYVEKLVSNDSDESQLINYLFKHLRWSYEREWRVFALLSEADRVIDLEPFPVHLYQFPKTAVSCIVFGFRASSETIKSVLRILAASADYSDVKILKIECEFNDITIRAIDA